jgi:UDP-glucose 4-epimerase
MRPPSDVLVIVVESREGLLMSRILVVGGAGYIGSHMMKALAREGHEPVAFDNLSTGHADAIIDGELVVGDLGNRDQVADVIKQGRFDGVMHFASNIEVGESVGNPRKYYTNNVLNTLNLVHAMMDQGLNNLIFSSTAAVYGTPGYTPVDEDQLEFDQSKPDGPNRKQLDNGVIGSLGSYQMTLLVDGIGLAYEDYKNA